MTKDLWMDVNSSSIIKKIRHHDGNVDIEYKDKEHFDRYYNVSTTIFNEMMNSASLSLYIKKKIKPNYPHFEFNLNKYEEQIKDLEEMRLSIIDFAKTLEQMRNNKLPDFELINLSKRGSEKIRESLAYVEDLPKNVITELCNDPNIEVKKRMINRTDLSKTDLNLLKKNAPKDIIEMANNKLESS